MKKQDQTFVTVPRPVVKEPNFSFPLIKIKIVNIMMKAITLSS